MTVINNPSKQMQNGDNVTVYNNTVGTVTETFTFPTSQETIILSNKGSKNITYTIGANTGTLTPSTSVKVTGAFSSLSLSSEQGTQAFEVWSEEAGTLGVTSDNRYGLTTLELFNQSLQVVPNITDNSYLNNDGSIASLGSYAISTYIPVNSNAFYYLNQRESGQGLYGCWYDSNKSYISGLTGFPIFSSPANASFVRLNINKNLTFTKYSFQSINSSLSGWKWEKINFLGDSITAGYPGISTIPIPFVELVKNMLGLSVARNYGLSGSEVQGASGSFLSRYDSMDNDADLIFVFGGTNDFGHNLPLGTSADTTNISFYGALDVLMTGLINKYPSKPIVFATPIHRAYTDSGVSGGLETNNGGKTLLQYVNAIKDTAQKYGIPVLDLYSTSGIQPSVSALNQLYTTDGLHPNQTGHQRIANRIVGFLNTL